jgi:hypothetical protein
MIEGCLGIGRVLASAETLAFYEKVVKIKGRRGGHPFYFFRDT